MLTRTPHEECAYRGDSEDKDYPHSPTLRMPHSWQPGPKRRNGGDKNLATPPPS
jgi:hypothetical protein